MRFYKSSLLTLVIGVTFSFKSMSQQAEEFSLIRENAYILNPALSGAKGFLAGTITYRKQFANVTQSPYTTYLALEGQIANKNIGLGGYILHDQTGPTGMSGIGLSAAYQIRLNKHELVNEDIKPYNTKSRHMITIGLGVEVKQYRLDAAALRPDVAADPELASTYKNQYLPDASLGVYYQLGEKFFAGISVPQLLGLNVKYAATNGSSEIRKVQHINFLIGGRINLGREKKWALEPVGALRWANNAPPQADLGMRLNFNQIVWLGVNYRTLSKVIGDVGFEIKGIGRLCYAAGIETTDIRRIGLSHEVTLSFRIESKKSPDIQILNMRFR